jgi:hypothetical protein
MVWPLARLSMGTARVIVTPAPFVSAFVDAVDQAIRAHHPSHGMSAMPRAWLACCVTAVLVTNSMCWARFARASLATYSLAAVSWMFRHRKMPWDALVVASVRVLLRHYGLTCGSLVIDDRDNKRSKSATTLAHRYTLRDKDRGGYVWGQSLVFLLGVTPDLTLPVGLTFYQPAPELSAWYQQDKALKEPDVPPQQRPPKPPPKPYYPTTQALARRLFAQFTAQPPTFRVHCLTADALYGTATLVEGAAALCRTSASGAVKKWERWLAGRGCTSAPTTPNGSSWPSNMRAKRRLVI